MKARQLPNKIPIKPKYMSSTLGHFKQKPTSNTPHVYNLYKINHTEKNSNNY